MKINDMLLGLFFMTLSAAILIVAAGFPTLDNQNIGAGTFPMLIASVMGLCGLALALSGVREFRLQNAVQFAAWIKAPGAWVRMLSVPAFVIAYILFSKPIGFPIVVPVILSALLVLTTGKPVRAVAVAIATSVAIWILFAQVLRVPLPLGLLTEVIY